MCPLVDAIIEYFMEYFELVVILCHKVYPSGKTVASVFYSPVWTVIIDTCIVQGQNISGSVLS
jgi:hypothetical protein